MMIEIQTIDGDQKESSLGDAAFDKKIIFIVYVSARSCFPNKLNE